MTRNSQGKSSRSGFKASASLFRLFRIGRTLAGFDALQPPAGIEIPATARLMLGLFSAMFGTRRPDLRPGERLAAALGELGPSFIKLGQALSVRPDLIGDQMAEDLGSLRDRLPPFNSAEARAVIEAELHRPIREAFSSFDDAPVAAASIAQVHFARLTDETGSPVAVKVLRPGIEQAFARDIALFYWLAHKIERHVPAARRLRPLDVVDTLAQSVAMEMDLRLEAAAASELRDNFAADADLVVPAPHWPLTSKRVMTIARVEGISIDDRDALLAAGHDLKELAAKVIRTFLKQALRDGYFHADLHQGNLFVEADGRLAAVDFGIMGRIDMPTRRFMAEMLHAFVTGNWRRAAEVHFTAGYVPAHHSIDAFAQACRSIGEPIMGRAVNEISIGRLLAQLFQVTETFDMHTQPQLLLLQKTMVTVEGVARTLDPEINFWSVSQPVVEQWIADNLSPDALLAEAAREGMSLVRRLPALFDDLTNGAARMSRGEISLDAESIERLAEAEAAKRRPWSVTIAAGLWMLALLGLASFMFG